MKKLKKKKKKKKKKCGKLWVFKVMRVGSRAANPFDSAEDFLIFWENKLIGVHKFDNLPDSGNILSIELYVIWKIFLICE